MISIESDTIEFPPLIWRNQYLDCRTTEMINEVIFDIYLVYFGQQINANALLLN